MVQLLDIVGGTLSDGVHFTDQSGAKARAQRVGAAPRVMVSPASVVAQPIVS